LAALILRSYAQSVSAMLPLVYFLPMLLAVGGGFVAQSLASVGSSLADDGRQVWRILGREVGLGVLVGAVAGLLVALLAYLGMGTLGLGVVLGISLATTLPIAGAVGALLPIVLKRVGGDPSWASSAVLVPLVSVVSVFIYLGLATYLIQHLV